MGTTLHYFGEATHTDSKLISEGAQKNRMLLKEVMESVGLKNYEKEWWHFNLNTNEEEFPDTYFDNEII